MGHERIGFLPKTARWNKIIEQLALFDGDQFKVMEISDSTLNNVKSTYEKLPFNESIFKAFKYLVLLSTSSNADNQMGFLKENGINVDKNMSLISLAMSVKKFINSAESADINKMAQDAVLKTITTFEKNQRNGQLTLFDTENINIWGSIGKGSDFCVLAKTFFGAFTENNLKYHLERELARSINDFRKMQSFSTLLTQNIDSISNHAFETAHIMQSFAAGWYNKHAVRQIPNEREMTGFLQIAFGKIREELRREVSRND